MSSVAEHTNVDTSRVNETNMANSTAGIDAAEPVVMCGCMSGEEIGECKSVSNCGGIEGRRFAGHKDPL